MNLFHEAKKVLDKDGKVNPLGPYGKMKLTGQEVANYFRKNKVSDAKVKRAVEVALDMSGAMDIASKEIKKFFGDKILKSKEVQNALRYANESVVSEGMKMKDIMRKHKRELNKAYKSGDLSFMSSAGKKAEDDLMQWAMDNGEVKTDDPDDFFDWLSRDLEDIVKGKIKEDVSEKFSPYNDKQYPRCVDFYIQFRGGKGDRITSPENKKDFIKATDMIDAYCKKNKIKQKPVYSTPMEGSSAYKVGLMIDKSYSKTSDYDDGKDLQPLYVALSKLKTAEDHGGGWSVMVPKGLGPVKEAEVEEGKDKIKYRGNLKGLMDSKDMKEETESLLVQHFIKEAMSKKMDIKKYAGKVGFDKAEIKWIIDNEEEDHYENNSAMKNEWIALSYPIRSGDYYFAFIGDRMTDEKISQVNQKMNDLLRKEKVKAEKMTFDDEPYNEDMVASHLWNYMSAQFQKLPASLGAEDTMTRECLYTAIKHLTDDGEIMFEHTLAEGMFKNLAKGMLGKIRNKLRKVKRTIKLGKKAVIKASKEMSHEEAKYKANKSVMDTYKNMWEEELKEEMITYRVKKMHPAEKKKFEQSGRQMGLKVTMNTNQQDTLVVMSGTKKKLRDFDSVARGKSSYGDPSTVKHFDEED